MCCKIKSESRSIESDGDVFPVVLPAVEAVPLCGLNRCGCAVPSAFPLAAKENTVVCWNCGESKRLNPGKTIKITSRLLFAALPFRIYLLCQIVKMEAGWIFLDGAWGKNPRGRSWTTPFRIIK